MIRLTLSQRLAAVFALLLAVCSGASIWLQVRANRMHELEVAQSLSRGLAAHIAGGRQLMDADGPMPRAVQGLFSQLMMVNPSVEVYLLDPGGQVVGHAAPPEHLKRERVDLAPVRRFLAGEPLPITGDDPRSDGARKVFSAAPLVVDGRDLGYVYVVLQGEEHDRLAGRGATSAVLGSALWAIALVGVLCLAAGLAAFRLITRPLRRLTEAVRGYDLDGEPAPLPATQAAAGPRDEIAVLDRAFRQMTRRLSDQWRRLTRQEQERRELIANISHDLRTPLASLHGYLETLLLKDAALGPAERRRYLSVALDQSGKVGGLARSLFELVRLEQGYVQLDPEPFALDDLVQDVFQKFELAAEARGVALAAEVGAPLPAVRADLGLIERVLTNLLDNAVRHTPAGGTVSVALAAEAGGVRVVVRDTGPGIPPERRAGLFDRPFDVDGARRGGGLGLRIVYRILQLHGVALTLLDEPGAAFAFTLPAAGH